VSYQITSYDANIASIELMMLHYIAKSQSFSQSGVFCIIIAW